MLVVYVSGVGVERQRALLIHRQEESLFSVAWFLTSGFLWKPKAWLLLGLCGAHVAPQRQQPLPSQAAPDAVAA